PGSPNHIGQCAQRLIEARDATQRIAASRVETGTDVNFGALSQQLINSLANDDVDVKYGHKVKGLSRDTDGRWEVAVKDTIGDEKFTAKARFVFIGAGGGALDLLQSSGIPESKGYG